MLVCDNCDYKVAHLKCLGLKHVPLKEWMCVSCSSQLTDWQHEEYGTEPIEFRPQQVRRRRRRRRRRTHDKDGNLIPKKTRKGRKAGIRKTKRKRTGTSRFGRARPSEQRRSNDFIAQDEGGELEENDEEEYTVTVLMSDDENESTTMGIENVDFKFIKKTKKSFKKKRKRFC